jgi:hypothetical protein
MKLTQEGPQGSIEKTFTLEVVVMKSKPMMIVTLCVVLTPFVGASTRAIEKSNPGAAGGAAAEAQVTSARYRVTVNGFRVDRETYDTAFETDGKGDEVFILTEARTVAADGVMGPQLTRRSKTYGDTNGFSERIQAGERSDKGGLKTGDRAPARDLTRPRPGGMRTFADQLPMVVWEGTLYRDRNMAVIMPTIWEWDLRSIHFPTPGGVIPHDVTPEWILHRTFNSWMQGLVRNNVGQSIRTTFATTYSGRADRSGWWRDRSSADVFNMGTNGTRVIGLRQLPSSNSTEPPQDAFQPMVLVLTYTGAEQSVSSGNTIFQMTYEEPRCCGLEGSYTLFLQLERVP